MRTCESIHDEMYDEECNECMKELAEKQAEFLWEYQRYRLPDGTDARDFSKYRVK